MNRELVGEVTTLRHLDGVDLSDEVGDRGVGGRELLAVTAIAVYPFDRGVVASIGDDREPRRGPRTHPAGEVDRIESPGSKRLRHRCRAAAGPAHDDDAAIARQLRLVLTDLPHRQQHGLGRVLGQPLIGLPHVEEQRARVDETSCGARPDLWRGADAVTLVSRRGRQPCARPCAVASEEIGDIREPGLEQDAGCDRGAVAAGAVHDHRTSGVESRQRVGEHRERDLSSTGQGSRRRLAGAANVDELKRRLQPTQLGELLDREPRARLDDVASSGEDPSGLVELPGDPVVPDPPESNLGFERDRRVSHENDLTVGRQHIARPLGEPTLASYAVVDNALFIRSESHLWKIGRRPESVVSSQ